MESFLKKQGKKPSSQIDGCQRQGIRGEEERVGEMDEEVRRYKLAVIKYIMGT